MNQPTRTALPSKPPPPTQDWCCTSCTRRSSSFCPESSADEVDPSLGSTSSSSRKNREWLVAACPTFAPPQPATPPHTFRIKNLKCPILHKIQLIKINNDSKRGETRGTLAVSEKEENQTAIDERVQDEEERPPAQQQQQPSHYWWVGGVGCACSTDALEKKDPPPRQRGRGNNSKETRKKHKGWGGFVVCLNRRRCCSCWLRCRPLPLAAGKREQSGGRDSWHGTSSWLSWGPAVALTVTVAVGRKEIALRARVPCQSPPPPVHRERRARCCIE
jgi:hypothetical protein